MKSKNIVSAVLALSIIGNVSLAGQPFCPAANSYIVSTITADAADLEVVESGTTQSGLKYDVYGTREKAKDEDGNFILDENKKMYTIFFQEIM